MKQLPYNELQRLYKESQAVILELRETIDDKEDQIELLRANISELEDILYEFGIFKHFTSTKQ